MTNHQFGGTILDMTSCECGRVPVIRSRSDGMCEIVCIGHNIPDRIGSDTPGGYDKNREVVLLVAPGSDMAEEEWEKWRAEEKWKAKKFRFDCEAVQCLCSECRFVTNVTRLWMGFDRCCGVRLVPVFETDKKLVHIRDQIAARLMTARNDLSLGEAQCLGGVPGLEELFDQERGLIESVLGGKS